MSQKRPAPRPVATFESKTLLDYVKGNTLREIKYSCVRAKELDDKIGGKHKGSYLLAMVELAGEIHKELGVKAGKAKGSNKADKALTEKVKELEAQVKSHEETQSSKITELEAQVAELTNDAADMDKLFDEATTKVAALNEANQALTKANESLIGSTTKPAAKKTAAKKTTKKGAK